jgi:hypothetical protein
MFGAKHAILDCAECLQAVYVINFHFIHAITNLTKFVIIKTTSKNIKKEGD